MLCSLRFLLFIPRSRKVDRLPEFHFRGGDYPGRGVLARPGGHIAAGGFPAVVRKAPAERRLPGDVARQAKSARVEPAGHLDFRALLRAQDRRQTEEALDDQPAIAVNIPSALRRGTSTMLGS